MRCCVAMVRRSGVGYKKRTGTEMGGRIGGGECRDVWREVEQLVACLLVGVARKNLLSFPWAGLSWLHPFWCWRWALRWFVWGRCVLALAGWWPHMEATYPDGGSANAKLPCEAPSIQSKERYQQPLCEYLCAANPSCLLIDSIHLRLCLDKIPRDALVVEYRGRGLCGRGVCREHIGQPIARCFGRCC